MDNIKVDKYTAALKLIEILLEKENKSSHIYKYREAHQFAHFTSGLIIGRM